MSSNSINELQQEIVGLQEALLRENEELRKAKERSELSERMLRTLVSTAVSNIGQDFLDSIVTKLAEWLGTECVLIGRLESDGRVYASPMYLDGKLLYDFSYDLADSPCEMTSKKGFCSYPENVINLFPKDQILVDMNAEGYMGIALYDKQGVASGVICAVSRSKIQMPPYSEMLLQIVGDRVTAELHRKEAEQALIDSEAKLRDSNATKDKFFSLIAHDLKSPFNALNGLLELLQVNYHKYDDKKRLHFIDHVLISTKRVNGLLENLLAWAYNQQGKIDFQPNRLSLNTQINESLGLIRPLAEEKGIEVLCNLEENYYVMADRNMLLAILRNLFSNAVKFTDKGGVVEVKIHDSADPKLLVLNVCDDGVGIDPRRLQNFFKLDKDNTTLGTNAEKGTGLGLIICKEFAERHGGTLQIESAPGTGSSFSFSLERVL